MATFKVDFLGCKVSHTDAHAVRERLLADGHSEGADADVAVLNTCCVTGEAVAKSRKAAARLARAHGRVYVTGCGASLGSGFAGLPANVVVVAKRSEETPGAVADDLGALGCVQADARLDRVRAFVKIQDGCSFSCGFCVVPLVRGESRSRRAGAVLAEIRRRVEQGHREVVLTGINLGCFRDRSDGWTLPRLVREAGATPGLARLRLSSIEINHVSEALVAALRETPTVTRHLHVPLQSGDDGVLRAMGRRYTVATYLRRLEPLEDFNLTTDAIVGFPAEDEAAFAATLRTVERAGITKVHVFPYSPRPGTPAATLPDQVPKRVVQERYERLLALQEQVSWDENESQLGRTLEVLVAEGEGRKDGATHRLSGRAPDNRLVHFAVPADLVAPRPGDVVTVEVTYAAPHHLVADGTFGGVRRTRAGDAWELRQGRAPVSPGVLLGMPTVGAPLAPPTVDTCA
jgi:tRNA-2-methylthio-N6-dimethylallyladenosine synthase